MTAGAPLRSPVVASVVIVLPTEDGHDATVDAVVRATPERAEVIVVVNGGATHASLGPARWPRPRLVTVQDPLPFAAAANLGASVAVAPVVCFVCPGAVVSDGWLAPLLTAVDAPGVACAVPRVVAPDGRVLEAGTVLGGDGAPVPVASPTGAPSLEHAFPRRTAGGSRGVICVRRSAFVDAGGFDPRLDDPLAAGADLSRALRAVGLDTVYEPDSAVVLDPAAYPSAREAPVAARDGDCPDRVLVIARALPSRPATHGGRRLAQLVSDLAALVPDGRLTVVALDGHHARPAALRMLRQGIEVVVGPQDWDEWFGRRPFQFSHVLVTDLPALRRLGTLLDTTQPQAYRVLCLPSLDFRDVLAAAPPDAGPEEKPGIRLLAAPGEDQVAAAARRSHAAWCATQADRAWLEGTVPGLRCHVVPTGAVPAAPVPFAQRSGYVVLAAPGADVTAGHEDAALHAVREMLPTLLARDPHAVLRVVVDDPSPALQLLPSPNVELVAAGDDPARWFRRSRVCLAWYPRGSGSREALELAVDARTPFVTSQAAADDAGVGAVSALVAAQDPQAAVLLAERLHAQPRLWQEAQNGVARLADGARSGIAVRLRQLRAYADVGIAPKPGRSLDEPLEPMPVDEPAPVRPRNVAVVGSAWKAAPPAEDGRPPDVAAAPAESDWTDVPVNEQYHRWCARYGPTRRRLDRLARRLAGLVRRPTISVVMPVFNTEPSWLDDAITSVRSQVYENWELCIGDDGSTDRRTLEVLEAHARDDPRVRLVHLPGQQGIAAASNAALALATGEFVGFLDHDDELKPHALGEIAVLLDERPDLDLVYSDEDKREPDGRLVDPFFKPDWSPDHLMSRNYVCHFLVLRRKLADKLGGFRLGYDGSQDYDLVLRATELTTAIAHLPEPLYTWRKVEGSTSGDSGAKPWALDAARRALADALERRERPGEVLDGMHPTTYRVRYAVRGRPKVSILIPTRDRVDLLRNCVHSILERSTYANYELLVVDNQSSDPETLGYLATFPGRVVAYPHRFNYARMMNLAAHEAGGDLLLFLNNDTQVVSPDWMEALIEHAQRPEVGAVAPRLRYPSGHPQHEGTIVGYKGGHAGNVDHRGFWGMGDIVRNCSAVTGACMMMRPSVHWELGGHDERLRVAFNDVDLCLRARQAGYEIVYTPYAELIHVEGGTRGIHAHPDDDERFEGHWVTHKCLDPYYNPNFERLYPFRIRS